ncbi:snoRNP complex protein nop56 [Terramyces sp. JEL0728]|nr:snoRNP complex protein nop56 [Terramyces sp. JEL0728]
MAGMNTGLVNGGMPAGVNPGLAQMQGMAGMNPMAAMQMQGMMAGNMGMSPAQFQAMQAMQAGMMQQQQQQQQAQTPQPAPQPVYTPKPAADQNKPKRKRPTDKTLSRKIEAYVPESKLFNQMQEYERRLDATITRKALDIQDSLSKPPKKVNRTMRVFLSNLASNQPWDTTEPTGDKPPNTRKQTENQPKFSSFFKSIVIEIERDTELFAQGNIIQWQNASSAPEMDGFEVKRRGDSDVNLKVMLHLDHQPERHRLSPPLAKLLDVHTDTLPNVIMAVWQYIKSHRLQDNEDRKIINCDFNLQAVFGIPKIMFPSIPDLLSRHLFPADPVILNYTVRVDKEYHSHTAAFDIQVPVPDPIREKFQQVNLGNIPLQREIATLDEKIAAIIQTINLSKLKRDFMISFTKDPVNFINKWVASQSRDLEVVLGDTTINVEDARNSEFFENEQFKEALFHYLRQKEVQLATGYTLFERISSEEIGQNLEDVQKSITDYSRFQKIIKLKSFAPFRSAAHALENAMDVSEGIMSAHLKAFLELNLAKAGKKQKVILGVGEATLGGAIKEGLGYDCQVNDVFRELIRGVKMHADKLLSQLKEGDLSRAQLGLGHAYSRSKVKFNVNRVDNMITQSIALLDQLDKDVNTFSMRVREWYGWHFPELVKIITDNAKYAQLVKFIKNKSDLSPEHLEGLEAITSDPVQAKQILDAARASMGTNISEIDMSNVLSFADRVISLTEYRKSLYGYLCNKMHAVAPNLSALIGEVIGARLISHAGSLTNLAKAPASTVQILGAEKALFRALKTRGNTPKYGLIYHSTFIGRAGQKNKGRISRVLANKVSIAARIDCFIDNPTSKFGEVLREQVEERLKFYEEGVTPRKNAEVMSQAMKEIGMMDVDEDEEPVGKFLLMLETPKKRKADEAEKKSKKEKKEKPAEESEKKSKKEKKEKKDKDSEKKKKKSKSE